VTAATSRLPKKQVGAAFRDGDLDTPDARKVLRDFAGRQWFMEYDNTKFLYSVDMPDAG